MAERERKFKQEMEILRQKELDKLQEELIQKEAQTREEEVRLEERKRKRQRQRQHLACWDSRVM